jgi:hypothetical protein
MLLPSGDTMDYLILLLIQAAFLIAVATAFYLGRKTAPSKQTKPPDPDNEEHRRAKEMRTGFMNMMEYDVDKALQRKKVT